MENFTFKTWGLAGCMALVAQWSVAQSNELNAPIFKVVEQPGISWQDASKIAENMDGDWHLATITTPSEQAALKELLADTKGEYWLGGFQTESEAANAGWQWITGERFAYNAWHVLEPNDAQGRQEAHLATRDILGWQWNDESNLGLIYGFVIEQANPQTTVSEVPLQVNIIPDSQRKTSATEDQMALNIFPNPNDGHFSLDFKTSKQINQGTISIVSAIGTNIFSKEVTLSRGILQEKIILQNAAPGVYFVHFTTEEGDQVQQMVIQ